MANNDNLKPFKKGYDSRRGSKPKGAKHVATYIREALENNNFRYKLPETSEVKAPPIAVILDALINKAANGDIKATELLFKHGYANKLEIEFSNNSNYTGPKLTSYQLEQMARLRRQEEQDGM